MARKISPEGRASGHLVKSGVRIKKDSDDDDDDYYYCYCYYYLNEFIKAQSVSETIWHRVVSPKSSYHVYVLNQPYSGISSYFDLFLIDDNIPCRALYNELDRKSAFWWFLLVELVKCSRHSTFRLFSLSNPWLWKKCYFFWSPIVDLYIWLSIN